MRHLTAIMLCAVSCNGGNTPVSTTAVGTDAPVSEETNEVLTSEITSVSEEPKPYTETVVDDDGSLSDWYVYEYDEKDNEIRVTVYAADNSVRSWTDREYDERGNEVRFTYHNPDGSVDHRVLKMD